MKKVNKVFIDDEVIYLKKNKWLGWSVIKPWKNEDGTINWFNMIVGGNWIKFLITLFIVFVILGAINEYVSILKTASQCMANAQPILIPVG